MWSVTSMAPALSEAEAPPALRHLSEEAEAPLLRYLGEFYSVPADPAASQPQGSRLFCADAAPSPGIPLTADFIAEYNRIANEPTPTPRASGFRRSFLFQPKDTEKYLSPEVSSPEVLALGDHAGRGGLLRQRAYLTEDKRWTQMATFARSSMRLTAYAGALTNLAAQAAERHVTPEDRQLLDSLLLAITELLWKQSTRAALSTPRLGGHHGRRLRTLHHTRWLYSRALRAPTQRRRPSSHPAHAPSHPSRHSSGDYRLAQQGGNKKVSG